MQSLQLGTAAEFEAATPIILTSSSTRIIWGGKGEAFRNGETRTEACHESIAVIHASSLP